MKNIRIGQCELKQTNIKWSNKLKNDIKIINKMMMD